MGINRSSSTANAWIREQNEIGPRDKKFGLRAEYIWEVNPPTIMWTYPRRTVYHTDMGVYRALW